MATPINAAATSTPSLQEVLETLFANGLHKVGNYHKQHDEEVVVSHLHVVGFYFKGCEHHCNDEAPQVFAPISQHHACYHRRKISQSHHLPEVSGGDNDKKIGRKCPQNTA